MMTTSPHASANQQRTGETDERDDIESDVPWSHGLALARPRPVTVFNFGAARAAVYRLSPLQSFSNELTDHKSRRAKCRLIVNER